MKQVVIIHSKNNHLAPSVIIKFAWVEDKFPIGTWGTLEKEDDDLDWTIGMKQKVQKIVDHFKLDYDDECDTISIEDIPILIKESVTT